MESASPCLASTMGLNFHRPLIPLTAFFTRSRKLAALSLWPLERLRAPPLGLAIISVKPVRLALNAGAGCTPLMRNALSVAEHEDGNTCYGVAPGGRGLGTRMAGRGPCQIPFHHMSH